MSISLRRTFSVGRCAPVGGGTGLASWLLTAWDSHIEIESLDQGLTRHNVATAPLWDQVLSSVVVGVPAALLAGVAWARVRPPRSAGPAERPLDHPPLRLDG